MHYLYTTQSFRADRYLALAQVLSKLWAIKEMQNKEERITSVKEQHKKGLEDCAFAGTTSDVITVPYLAARLRDRLPDASSIIINESSTNIKFVNDHLIRSTRKSLFFLPPPH